MVSPLQAGILLNKYNPTLVIFPQEPDTRGSPDAQDIPQRLLGDYHPCSAKFFLARVEQRDQPRPYGLFPRKSNPTGLDRIKTKLATVQDLTETRRWELDVAGIKSQNGKEAWKDYGTLLKERDHPHPYECVVYARWYQASDRAALQYWYLYMYNDFFNNHEADWEMVAIELGSDQAPVQMGFAAHHGGLKVPWSKVRVIEDSPLVYVAKGSHAAYPAYQRKGYQALTMDYTKNLPPRLKWAESLLEWAAKWRALRDFPPAHPDLDTGAPKPHYGEAIKPNLIIIPNELPPADSDFWWRRYQGRWGSWHTRIGGWTGVGSPWAPSAPSDLRWMDPIAWIKNCQVSTL